MGGSATSRPRSSRPGEGFCQSASSLNNRLRVQAAGLAGQTVNGTGNRHRGNNPVRRPADGSGNGSDTSFAFGNRLRPTAAANTGKHRG